MMENNTYPDTRIVTIPVPLTLSQAFDAVKFEIDAVPDCALVKVNVDVVHATSTAMGAADRLQELLPALAKLPEYDLRPVRDVGTYAGAALHAHLLAMEPQPRDAELPAMLQEAGRLRGDLRAMAETLGRFGLLSADHVAALRPGRRHLDLAKELCALATLFDQKWSELEHRVPISRAMVDRAATLGAELHTVLGRRRLVSRLEQDGADRRRTRARAFSLFMGAYDHCRRGVSFLRWTHDDVEHYVPSLYPRRAKPRAGHGASVDVRPRSTPVPSFQVKLVPLSA